ncbi:CAP domain-containing protein [Sinobaca qinghaiensis]|uniref:CAP domain-containing protein n=2 Tax=Sinobaca qinghaiensis TaxID=342944 RepID=A0A419UX32_9BACL|nr:CAP domain-containing protein [Sinobaca qinghaiensis]
MRRMILLVSAVLVVFWTKPIWEEPAGSFMPEPLNDVINNGFDFEEMTEDAVALLNNVTGSEQDREQEAVEVEEPELTTPEDQSFSVGNIELGDTRQDVEDMYGESMRESENEYGVNWLTYHENYQNFMMVSFNEEGIVQGLYTNQNLLSSQYGIALGDSKSYVNETLGEPEEMIRSGRFNYQINSEGEYDVHQIDGSYVTVFYDVHEENEVTAVQIINENMEAAKESFYTDGSESLKEGFEYQLFDLTNAARVQHDLPVLEWNEEVRETARAHSTDMADNQFFSHTNEQGQSPFERMEEDDITFTRAGENLAYGQFSSVFAHQGLMNSMGHRENILNESFTELGVGVDFNEDNQPFFTENFITI